MAKYIVGVTTFYEFNYDEEKDADFITDDFWNRYESKNLPLGEPSEVSSIETELHNYLL